MRTDPCPRLGPPLAGFLALGAAPALAATTCDFNAECYMTEACAVSGWELTLDREAGVIGTVFGDLTIVHTEAAPAQRIAATGPGALYLLTIGEEVGIFTAHIEAIGAAPSAITYVGECFAE